MHRLQQFVEPPK